MIVPRNKLLVWVAWVFLPFSLLAALVPGAVVLSLSAIGLFLLVAFVDAASTAASLRGIGVQLPGIVRMSKDRAGKLELRIRNERQSARILRLGLPLPPEIASEQTDAYVTLPDGAEWSRFDWPCLPGKRGNYPIDSIYLEEGSRLGLWAWRKSAAVKSEIRVYPNLFTERKEL